MRKLVTVLAVVGVLMVVSAPQAMAQSAHFRKNGSPTCTVTESGSSATVVCRGALAGLGNEDLVINTTVEGFAVYQCQNAGGNIAPGQNRVLVGPSTVPTTIDSDAIKNGNVSFVTNPNTLSAPTTVSGAAAGCPNPQWTGVNPDLTITGISMTIEQGGELLFTCGASNSSGLSGTVALNCS